MKTKQEDSIYQVRLLDEKIVYTKQKQMPHINEVLAEVPCFTCSELVPECDEEDCEKLTAWAKGGQ